MRFEPSLILDIWSILLSVETWKAML